MEKFTFITPTDESVGLICDPKTGLCGPVVTEDTREEGDADD